MEHETEELKAHAVRLQKALNVSVQSELLARRELDLYRQAEIAELRGRLASAEESDEAREDMLRAAGVEEDLDGV